MTVKNKSVHQMEVLDKLIQNAAELPVESQNLLLMLAKGMAYTRTCLIKQNLADQNCVSCPFIKRKKGKQ